MLFYDFEVFKHDWLVVVMDADSQKTYKIVNDADTLKKLYEGNKNNIWVGYNNKHYDQYIMKGILCGFDPFKISNFIINEDKPGWQYSSLFNRIQMYNYDVSNGINSLKQLEGFLGNSIKESDVDFKINRALTDDEINETFKYCCHDVEQTIEVFLHTYIEFDSQMSLIKEFNLPLKNISKSKVQLSAMILGAKKTKEYDDEFKFVIPNTLKLSKYQYILDWYKNPLNLDYDKELKVKIANDVPHVFAWGGLHGAIKNYHSEGIFINVDVASYYPSLMIEYNYESRNIQEPGKYTLIYDTRLKFKAEKNPKQQPYKIVLNGTYGAMKDKNNPLYDPLQCNNVCIGGQLLLLDLIEKLEVYADIIQSNTDGILIKIPHMGLYEKVINICKEWEQRTRMGLEYEEFTKVIQKDVNNYIIVSKDGSYKSKGAYVKKLKPIDYDLPIVNKALVNYLVKGIPIETTINNCNDLKEFQKITKVTSKYVGFATNEKIINEKTLRVFASRYSSGVYITKVKNVPNSFGGGKLRYEKVANIPTNAFIYNDSVNGVKVPRELDKQWYIDLCKKRLKDFIG